MARRKKVMGLPIGRRRTFPLGNAVHIGAMGATAVAAVPAARRALRMATTGAQTANKVGDAIGSVRQLKESVDSHSTTIGKSAGLVGGLMKLRKGQGKNKPKLAHLIEEHTDISAPRRVVYNQWTQLEMLPRIVKGVTAVEQEDDDSTQWTSKIGPVQRQWKARITEQVPDERIVWKSQGGPQHEGVVTFHSLDDDLTRVLLQMHYKPSGPLETIGNKLRIQRRRVRRDLRLFKHYLELRGEETGAWRGKISSNGATASRKAAVGTRKTGER